MKTYQTYKQVIDLWPTRQALADALGNLSGERVLVSLVNQWLVAGKIPRKHWLSIEEAAINSDIEGITLEILAEIDKQQTLEVLKNG